MDGSWRGRSRKLDSCVFLGERRGRKEYVLFLLPSFSAKICFAAATGLPQLVSCIDVVAVVVVWALSNGNT